MKFDGLILDVDGTIWDTTSIVAKAWNAAIEKSFPQVPRVNAEILKGQFGKTMDVIADNLFNMLSNEQKDYLIQRCEEEEQKALLENNSDISYPEVHKTIEEISKKIPVFIVSNCQSGYIEIVIEKNGIKNFISDFECFGNTGFGKSENINLVIKRNNLKSPVYIGDTQGDLESCEQSKIPFIWASYGFGKVDQKRCFKTINAFEELKKIIEE